MLLQYYRRTCETTSAYTWSTRYWCNARQASRPLHKNVRRNFVESIKKGFTEENDEAYSDIGFSPPRGCQRRPDICNLTPVESDKRHSKAACVSKKLIDYDIVRSDPADPVEVSER